MATLGVNLTLGRGIRSSQLARQRDGAAQELRPFLALGRRVRRRAKGKDLQGLFLAS